MKRIFHTFAKQSIPIGGRFGFLRPFRPRVRSYRIDRSRFSTGRISVRTLTRRSYVRVVVDRVVRDWRGADFERSDRSRRKIGEGGKRIRFFFFFFDYL